jgi:hypothetical protein
MYTRKVPHARGRVLIMTSIAPDRGRDELTCSGDRFCPQHYIVNETTLIVRLKEHQGYSCGGDRLCPS